MIYKVTSVTKNNIAKLKYWTYDLNSKALISYKSSLLANISIVLLQNSCKLDKKAILALQLCVSKTRKIYSNIEEITYICRAKIY